MAKKTKAQVDRENFHQAALKMSKYRLRKALSLAKAPHKMIREAEAEGAQEMVKLLMEKYDEGAIAMPGLVEVADKKDAGKSTERKADTSKEEPPDDPPEDPPDDDPGDDPEEDDFGINFDDDDDDSGGETEEEEDPPEEPPDDPEPEDDDDGRQAATEEQMTEKELGAIEGKLDTTMDTVTSAVEILSTLAEDMESLKTRVEKIEATTVESGFIIKVGLKRLYDMWHKAGKGDKGLSGYPKILEKAKEVALGVGKPKKDKKSGGRKAS